MGGGGGLPQAVVTCLCACGTAQQAALPNHGTDHPRQRCVIEALASACVVQLASVESGGLSLSPPSPASMLRKESYSVTATRTQHSLGRTQPLALFVIQGYPTWIASSHPRAFRMETPAPTLHMPALLAAGVYTAGLSRHGSILTTSRHPSNRHSFLPLPLRGKLPGRVVGRACVTVEKRCRCDFDALCPSMSVLSVLPLLLLPLLCGVWTDAGSLFAADADADAGVGWLLAAGASLTVEVAGDAAPDPPASSRSAAQGTSTPTRGSHADDVVSVCATLVADLVQAARSAGVPVAHTHRWAATADQLVPGQRPDAGAGTLSGARLRILLLTGEWDLGALMLVHEFRRAGALAAAATAAAASSTATGARPGDATSVECVVLRCVASVGPWPGDSRRHHHENAGVDALVAVSDHSPPEPPGGPAPLPTLYMGPGTGPAALRLERLLRFVAEDVVTSVTARGSLGALLARAVTSACRVERVRRSHW